MYVNLVSLIAYLTSKLIVVHSLACVRCMKLHVEELQRLKQLRRGASPTCETILAEVTCFHCEKVYSVAVISSLTVNFRPDVKDSEQQMLFSSENIDLL